MRDRLRPETLLWRNASTPQYEDPIYYVLKIAEVYRKSHKDLVTEGQVVQVFAQLFGKALQAQTRIAVVNTVLTFTGMWALGIPGLLLLSLFVFMCRFVPSVLRTGMLGIVGPRGHVSMVDGSVTFLVHCRHSHVREHDRPWVPWDAGRT